MSTRPWPALLLTPLMAALMCSTAAQATTAGIYANRNDNARTGANLQETVLTTANVNTNTFGKLFSYPVDGAIYAQPLYVANVVIPTVGTKNVLLVATMEDTVYAFDADGGGLIWRRDLKSPATGVAAIPIASLVNPNYGDIDPTSSVGIEGTPVIDPATKTLYLVARTKENGAFVQRLHGIDIATGLSRTGSGAAISGTSGVNTFNPKIENQRAGLVLTNGQVVVTWAGHQDFYDYHGWVMSFDKTTFARTGAFAVTDGAWGGGVWSSGRAPVVLDTTGDIVFFTGNGIGQNGQQGYDGAKNFSESVLRMSVGPTGLKVVDWFTPSHWAALDAADADLASSGPAAIPGTGLVIGGGKEGQMYLLNTAGMGRMQAGNPKVVQTLAASPAHEIKGGPVMWDRRNAGSSLLMYNWSDTDKLKTWTWTGNAFSATPATTGALTSASPGGFLSLSANGAISGTGIVWALSSDADASHAIRHGVLRAYDAENITRELWNSAALAQDDFGNFAKFNPPTIANGKVFVATFSKQINAYGLRTPVTPPPNGAGASPVFGTAAGTPFTDTVAAGQSLTGVKLNAGWWLDAIQAITTPGASAAHGGTGGTAYNVTWPAGEYLVRMFGKSGSGAISQLNFMTNTGRLLGPYGLDQGQGTTAAFDYTVPAGQSILGFTGRSGQYLNGLGVVYGPVVPVSPVSPVFGLSTGGAAFSDTVVAGQKLTGVNVRAGWWLDSIQGVTANGALSAHGGAGGQPYTASWPLTESLVRVYGKYGAGAVSQISFVTNTGRVLGPFGADLGQGLTTPFDYTAPAGMTIQGFSGRSGSYLDALGLIVGK